MMHDFPIRSMSGSEIIEEVTPVKDFQTTRPFCHPYEVGLQPKYASESITASRHSNMIKKLENPKVLSKSLI